MNLIRPAQPSDLDGLFGLAEHLNIAKPAVTRALDALSRLDFIRRIKDDTDLRNIFIERTPAGMAYLRTFSGLVLAAASGKDDQQMAPKHRGNTNAAA